MSDLKENTVSSGKKAEPSSEQRPHSVSKARYYFEQVGQLLIALLIVFAIRSSIIEPFKIPSGSMIPTLYVGDFIFVNKFAYGLKLPFSDLLGSPVNLIKRDPPKRGDIIVFLYPKDPSVHYIKRVVGTPGDVIEMKNKVLHVNGQPIPQEDVDLSKAKSVLEDVGDPRYSEEHIKMFREKLGDEQHLMMVDTNNEYNQNFGPLRVPEGNLFVMGDNRDFSNDSRYWGYVPMENVSGRAEVIWLSMWLNFSDMDRSSFKPGRIGTVLK